ILDLRNPGLFGAHREALERIRPVARVVMQWLASRDAVRIPRPPLVAPQGLKAVRAFLPVELTQREGRPSRVDAIGDEQFGRDIVLALLAPALSEVMAIFKPWG